MAESLWNVLQTAIIVQIIAITAVTEKLDAVEVIRIAVLVRDRGRVV